MVRNVSALRELYQILKNTNACRVRFVVPELRYI
jgi:hypothetical protein